MENTLTTASGPVIVEDDKVLLNKSSGDDFWKFCGGKVGDSETLEETAKRRVKEEMGIEIKIINPEPFKLEIKRPGTTENIALLYHFLAEKTGIITPGPDVKEWDWFDLDELPEGLAPNIRPTLKHFGFI
ncbi:MAG: NUDIX hydrolase [Candidatus Moranbacteria bacterium]|nr:NUDIX hydrolase [Candidatus Moranbacteria bacterium]